MKRSKLFSIEQAQAYLLGYSPLKLDGETYTLGRMQKLMRRLGNPQDSYKSIHVAGTSGKTSTAYFIRGLLQASGQRTGLTASPHVERMTERVQIDGTPLPDDIFLSYLNEFLGVIEQWSDLQPTYFELLVAFAFYVFAQEKVDYAVVEVGLGGLLDATNVMTRKDKVAVITPIGLDHTQVLGETVAEIALQKAGIIQNGTPVFIAPQPPEAARVILDVCRRRHAVYHEISGAIGSDSLPPFQRRNLKLAEAVYQFVGNRDGLTPISQPIREKVSRQTPPGRFETYEQGAKTIIFDGAHNTQKLAAFLDAYRKTGRIDDTVWIVGLVDAPDAKLHSCVKLLVEQPGTFIMTEFQAGQDLKARQSVDAVRLGQLAASYGRKVDVVIDAEQAMTLALKTPGSHIVVTGSLYLVGQLRRRYLS